MAESRFGSLVSARRLIPGLIGVLLIAHAKAPTLLQQIVDSGGLVVATRYSPTTYYNGPQGPSGFEFDLAHLFADYLGIELKMITPGNSAILPMVANGQADLAAAGLAVTPERRTLVRFGPTYDQISRQLVYRMGTLPPANLAGSTDGITSVSAGSGTSEPLLPLLDRSGTNWDKDEDTDAKELLGKVWKRELDYTVANSNDVQLNQRIYPELRVAYDVTDPRPLAWAFAQGNDDSLVRAAENFFVQIKQSGQLEQLHERYYGHVQDFDYVETRRFISDIYRRLPDYKPSFIEAAQKFNQDWRLLAAIGYQESHWDPLATSPTGVQGIMMLTRATADELNVFDRVDPHGSIQGGARYFNSMKLRIPADIAEPDRTWFALAAYNMGLGHLEDARKLTEKRGGDSFRWIDVKENLPLLAQKHWYKQTRHGYARGKQALEYVENIRSYYDILVWRSEPAKPASQLSAVTSSLLSTTSETATPVL
jgi:membrane-bound lytic murein transglycosylase F